VIGIFGLAKLIKWLFARCASATYAAISGLIIASPFSIFYKVSQDYSMGGINAVRVVVGIVALIVCAGITIMMSKMETAE
jgi:uncharacterized membrane protein